MHVWPQEEAGFPLLVRLLDTSAGHHATIAPAIAALTHLARNNAQNRCPLKPLQGPLQTGKCVPTTLLTLSNLTTSRIVSMLSDSDSECACKGVDACTLARNATGALGCCAEVLLKSCIASHRLAAISAGAVPALCNILVAGETGAPPVALGDVLKALYAVVAAESDSGTGTSELFASGGIHSLV